ncbi:hypothetical protein SDC9_16345 [bioreactor metagenome]|jgi:hypothetical protein|uniref:Uncharacterized protein n=1 Tax=bioreactor metagenome TaxID=1076179 RepID=A0A644TVU5_9ZZZZ|nr:hypothetical protein [Sphingobacteriia bacterium]
MTNIGYILTGLNLLLTILLALRKDTKKHFEALKNTIREELFFCYSECLSFPEGDEKHNLSETDAKTTKLSHLHFSLLTKYPVVQRKSKIISFCMPIAICSFILSIISSTAIIALIKPEFKYFKIVNITCSIVIPLSALLLQFIFLLFLENTSDYFEELSGQYTRKEY